MDCHSHSSGSPLRVRLEFNGDVVEQVVRGWADAAHALGLVLGADAIVAWMVDAAGSDTTVVHSDADWEGFCCTWAQSETMPLLRPVAGKCKHLSGKPSTAQAPQHVDPLSLSAAVEFDTASSSTAEDAERRSQSAASSSSQRNSTDSLDSASVLSAGATPSPPPPEGKEIHIDPTLADRLYEMQQSMKMSLDQVLALLLKRYDAPAGAARLPTLSGIPTHILVIIFLFLPASEMRRLSHVSSKWRGIVTTNYFVKQYVCHQGLYVIGGMNRKSVTLRSVVKCKPASPSWSESRPMQHDRYHCGTAVYDRKIFVFGGRNSETRLASCEMYDPLTNAWSSLPSLRSVRSAPACTVHQGAIYVFGGFDGQQEYRSVEKLDPTTRTWMDTSGTAPMPLEACELGALSLGKYVYVIGGTQRRHRPGQKVLDIVQRYDPSTNSWTVLPGMSTPRMCPAVVAYKGFMWVIGGSDGQHALNSVERYDPTTNTWTTAPSMLTNRSNATAAVAHGHIYVTGGFFQEALSSVERYSPTSGWVSMPWSLPQQRDACKVLAWE
eukprot:TRINITY_DN5361_c0_g1_i1.p1 TRINITY_DN5361_c0_g1~~TRINITY_DN5361_c0_g1_i1.p1  ORF type:complete len:578 (+),score=145.30 TRINITY_DN5361_c0_g1_i1:83-1735(+)